MTVLIIIFYALIIIGKNIDGKNKLQAAPPPLKCWLIGGCILLLSWLQTESFKWLETIIIQVNNHGH